MLTVVIAQQTQNLTIDINTVFGGVSSLLMGYVIYSLKRNAATWDNKADGKDLEEVKRLLGDNAKQDQELRKIVEENARQLAVYVSRHDDRDKAIAGLDQRLRTVERDLATLIAKS